MARERIDDGTSDFLAHQGAALMEKITPAGPPAQGWCQSDMLTALTAAANAIERVGTRACESQQLLLPRRAHSG